MSETQNQPQMETEVPELAAEQPLRKADRLKAEAEVRHQKAKERRENAVKTVKGGLRSIGSAISAAKEGLVSAAQSAAESKVAKIALAPVKFVAEPVAYTNDIRAGIARTWDSATDNLANKVERAYGFLGDRSENVAQTYEADRVKLQAEIDAMKAEARDILAGGGETAEAQAKVNAAVALEQRVNQLEDHSKFFTQKSEKHAEKRKNGTGFSNWLRNRGA